MLPVGQTDTQAAQPVQVSVDAKCMLLFLFIYFLFPFNFRDIIESISNHLRAIYESTTSHQRVQKLFIAFLILLLLHLCRIFATTLA